MIDHNLYIEIIKKLSSKGFIPVGQAIGYNPKSYYGDEQWVMYLDAENLTENMLLIRSEVEAIFPELEILDVIQMKITSRYDEVWIFFKIRVDNEKTD